MFTKKNPETSQFWIIKILLFQIINPDSLGVNDFEILEEIFSSSYSLLSDSSACEVGVGGGGVVGGGSL